MSTNVMNGLVIADPLQALRARISLAARARGEPALSPGGPLAGLSRRQRQIVERVQANGFVTIETLAEEFATSAQTVRREIIRLSELGVLQRFHGGAGLAEGTDRPMRPNPLDGAEEQARVAAAVAPLIADGASVFLDAGDMARAVGEALLAHRGLRVVTCNLPAALSLGRAPSLQVQLTGGELRGTDGALVGSQVTAMLQDVRVDLAVIGCGGFDRDGSPMDFDSERIAVKRAAIRSAQRTVVAVEAAAFGRAALMRIAPAAGLAVVASSAAPPLHLADAFAAAAVQVIHG